MTGKRWFVRVCFVLALSMSGGCIFLDSGGGGNNVPSCSAAINSFYDEGCTFLRGGDPITASEMITDCNEGLDEAPACGCQSEMDDLLVCVDDVRDQNCSRCDSELTDMNDCFSQC